MNNRRLIILISIGLLLASIGNGAVSYLKRVGEIDRQSYESYMSAYCGLPGGSPSVFGTRCWCVDYASTGQGNEVPSAVDEPPDRQYIYQNSGSERWLKIGKDALFAGFALLSLFLLRVRRARLPDLADSWPALLLAANVGVGFAISLMLWGGSFAVVGLRSFAFLAIVLLGGWVVDGLRDVARFIGWLLLAQAALVVVELIYGMPLRACPHSFRAAGTMVLSNSLGIFTVVALAFCASFSVQKNYLLVLLAAACALLVASGSGTGLVALFALLSMLALRRIAGKGKWAAVGTMLLLAVGMVVNLPSLTHRPDIYDSLFTSDGRVGKLEELLRRDSATEILIGRGVGFGTNTALNLAVGASSPTPSVTGTPEPFSADSTVIVLLTQLGILGIATFYGLLGWAFWRDPIARPTYLVIAIASLTINITEVFPVNFILGLALAHTLAVSRQARLGIASS